MSRKCFICNIHECGNEQDTELLSIKQHAKGKLYSMLNFISGLKAEQGSYICSACCGELEIAFNLKCKWHQSKFYRRGNFKMHETADGKENNVINENDFSCSSVEIKVEIDPQLEFVEDSSSDPVAIHVEQNINNGYKEWWSCFKKENSVEIEDMYCEQIPKEEQINAGNANDLLFVSFDNTEKVVQDAKSEENLEKFMESSKEDKNLKNNQVKEEYDEEEAIIRCEICDKTFSKVSTCRIHLKRMHSTENNRLTKVKGRRKYPVSEHDIFSHLKETQCEFCFKIFASIKILHKHKISHKDEEQPYRCNKPGCLSRFSYKHRARSHIINHSEKRFKCQYCDKKFSYSYNTKVHERTHTGERPYVCSFCNRSFASLYNMTTHMRRHTGEEPYKCRYCPKGFKSHSAHKIHEQSHTHEKPYKCSVCGKDFISSWSCKDHERIHTGEKPYKCQVCNKAFSDATRLGIHRRTHDGTISKLNSQRRRKITGKKKI